MHLSLSCMEKRGQKCDIVHLSRGLYSRPNRLSVRMYADVCLFVRPITSGVDIGACEMINKKKAAGHLQKQLQVEHGKQAVFFPHFPSHARTHACTCMHARTHTCTHIHARPHPPLKGQQQRMKVFTNATS